MIKTVLFVACIATAGALWFSQGNLGALLANTNVTDGDAAAGKPKSRGRGLVPVIVEPVDEAENNLLIQAIGTARARKSVMLFPDAEGEIMAFKVEAGDRVKKGELLLQLEANDAALAVRVAKTRVKEAERLFERAQRLKRNKVQSAANVDDAETNFERAKLELRQAEQTLADHQLRAPFAGVVGIAKVEVGDRVSPEKDIITIDDRETLLVEFELAERHMARVDVGMPVAATTPAFPDQEIKGVIERIDSRVDEVSRTVKVRAAFANDDDTLRPGMSFFIDIRVPGAMAAAIPELALQWNAGVSYVWRIVDGKADKVAVKSLNRRNETVLVSGDLKSGDLVVVEGVQRLRPGRAVDMTAADAGSK